MRIVRPERKRIVLPDGDWIEVKSKLNAGEQREMFARMITNDMAVGTDGRVGGSLDIDPVKGPMAQVLAYLLDWSVVDADGQVIGIKGEPPDVVASTLDLLDPDDYQEIVGAIQAHDAAIRSARAEEKKRRFASSISVPNSLSPVGVDGGTNG